MNKRDISESNDETSFKFIISSMKIKTPIETVRIDDTRIIETVNNDKTSFKFIISTMKYIESKDGSIRRYR